MSLIPCPKCGKTIVSDSKYCNKCGCNIYKEIYSNEVLVTNKNNELYYVAECSICKTHNNIERKYCKKCGQWLLSDISKPRIIEVQKTSKIKWIFFITLIVLFLYSSINAKLFLSFVIGIIGLINIIVPLKFIGINTRKAGVWFFLLSFVTLMICSYYLNNNKIPIINLNSNVIVDTNKFVSECAQIPYDDIARLPDNYINKKVKFTGKVIQALESGNRLNLRINVTKGEYEVYKDTILVNYNRSSSEKRVLENDIISIYGVFKGINSFKTVLGTSVNLPEIDAIKIEILQK